MSYHGTGMARVNADHPDAFAVCDRCGAWRNKSDLVWQFDYRGNSLTNLRILVCQERERCNDAPFEFFRPIIVGPDPLNIKDPRPENFISDYGLQGFTLYTLWNGPFPVDVTTYLMDDSGDIIMTQTGEPIAVEQGFGKQAVLAQVAIMSDIPTPYEPTEESTSIVVSGASQTLMTANPDRIWVLVYNPGSIPIAVSEGQAQLGVRPAINLGYGEAYFWATDQGTGDVYTGPLTVAGPFVGQQVWAWQA